MYSFINLSFDIKSIIIFGLLLLYFISEYFSYHNKVKKSVYDLYESHIEACKIVNEIVSYQKTLTIRNEDIRVKLKQMNDLLIKKNNDILKILQDKNILFKTLDELNLEVQKTTEILREYASTYVENSEPLPVDKIISPIITNTMNEIDKHFRSNPCSERDSIFLVKNINIILKSLEQTGDLME